MKLIKVLNLDIFMKSQSFRIYDCNNKFLASGMIEDIIFSTKNEILDEEVNHISPESSLIKIILYSSKNDILNKMERDKNNE